MRCHLAATVVLLLGGAVVASGPGPLPVGERIAPQRAIEEVYWCAP